MPSSRRRRSSYPNNINRTSIIVAIVAAIASIIVAFVNGCFGTGGKEKLGATTTGEMVGRDKIINIYNSPTDKTDSINNIEKKSKELRSRTPIVSVKSNPVKTGTTVRDSLPKIQNSGNLSIGNSGTVIQQQYQVAELPDRHLNSDDVRDIQIIMKPGYTAEVKIITSNSQETALYGNELLTFLHKNYSVTNSVVIGQSSEYKQTGRKRFYYSINETRNSVLFFVQTQQ